MAKWWNFISKVATSGSFFPSLSSWCVRWYPLDFPCLGSAESNPGWRMWRLGDPRLQCRHVRHRGRPSGAVKSRNFATKVAENAFYIFFCLVWEIYWFEWLRRHSEESRVAYVAALSSDVTQPPRTPRWNAPSGAQVTQTTTFSTQEKKNCKIRFRPLLCQHLNTWPPPRAAHGGVCGDTVIRRHPAATYATLDCSQHCLSNENWGDINAHITKITTGKMNHLWLLST